MPFFGAFEEQYSEYGPRMQRKRAFTAPERRRQFYVLQAPSPDYSPVFEAKGSRCRVQGRFRSESVPGETFLTLFANS